MIGLSLKGMDKLQKAIDSKNKALITGVDNEMKATVMEINAKQISRAPIDTGKLRQSIDYKKEANLSYTLLTQGMGAKYAPYIEFGTGDSNHVVIPKGLEEEAGKYRGTKGFVINRRAQPFFFAPFFEEKNNLIKRIQKLLDI
jgi:HK97 gp10 family phage protein